MKFSNRCLTAALLFSSVVAHAGVGGNAETCTTTTTTTPSSIPHQMEFVQPRLVLHGQILESHKESILGDVMGCCSATEQEDDDDVIYQQQLIGRIPQMNTHLTYQVLEDAKQAWKGGSGVWPQMSLKERIEAVQNFLKELAKKREQIVVTLMWEIGKNRKDAEAEFDRTVQFCNQAIDTIQTDPEFNSSWQTIGSTKAFIRRAAIGIIMCLGPMNYPLNETYATLIPALLMGNVAIMKIPTVGGLSHLLTSKFTLVFSLSLSLSLFGR
jgi:glyceraldehyde-3-phosphate dehydrogenase (NADP+)